MHNRNIKTLKTDHGAMVALDRDAKPMLEYGVYSAPGDDSPISGHTGSHAAKIRIHALADTDRTALYIDGPDGTQVRVYLSDELIKELDSIRWMRRDLKMELAWKERHARGDYRAEPQYRDYMAPRPDPRDAN